MSQDNDSIRKLLIKTDYEPVSSSRKLNLLLQRSVRYSYRQRCCNCCPTILCELLFPFIIIMLLVLSRYGMNKLADELQADSSTSLGFDRRPCSENLTTAPTSSNDLFKKCFKFPPRYKGGSFDPFDPQPVSHKTNIVFEPRRADIDEVVLLARKRLDDMMCNQTTVW